MITEGWQIMNHDFDFDTGDRVGYARVSTEREQLQQAGCVRIFAEKITGAKRNRPELERLLDYLRSGDVVVVTRLDRLARSTRDLLDIAERLRRIGSGLWSLAEPWADTTTPAGRMVLTVFAGIAEFERSLIAERTRRGHEAAQARGVEFGPKPRLSDEQLSHSRAVVAPDGSDVRLLSQTERGSMAHFSLAPGAISKAVAHRTIEEIWFFLGGRGRMWRHLDERKEVVDVHEGVSITIPTGTHFQFRSDSDEPLQAVAITMPPWPGAGEAYEVEGIW